MLLVATGTVLAGIYADLRLCLVGIGLWVGVLCVVVVEGSALAILLVGIVTVAVILVAHHLLRAAGCRSDRSSQPASIGSRAYSYCVELTPVIRQYWLRVTGERHAGTAVAGFAATT